MNDVVPPGFAGGGDRGIQQLAVVGVHRGPEGRHRRRDGGVPAEDLEDGVGPSKFRGGSVHFPIAQPRHALGLAEQGLLGGEGRFGALAVGDIVHHAEHVPRRAVGVAQHVAAFGQPPHGAVRPHAAVLEIILLAALDAGGRGVGHPLPVFRVHSIQKPLESGLHRPGRTPEEGRDRLRPEHGPGLEIPVPCADVGVVLADAQAFRGVLDVGDVGADRDVLVGSAGGIQERYDRALYPVEFPVLAAVADLTLPDFAVRDSAPETAVELVGMQARLDDAMVLAEQFGPGIAAHLAELVVDVDDVTSAVGDADDCVAIQRQVLAPALIQRAIERALGLRRPAATFSAGGDRRYQAERPRRV